MFQYSTQQENRQFYGRARTGPCYFAWQAQACPNTFYPQTITAGNFASSIRFGLQFYPSHRTCKRLARPSPTRLPGRRLLRAFYVRMSVYNMINAVAKRRRAAAEVQ